MLREINTSTKHSTYRQCQDNLQNLNNKPTDYNVSDQKPVYANIKFAELVPTKLKNLLVVLAKLNQLASRPSKCISTVRKVGSNCFVNTFRGVLKTLSNLYDGVFCKNNCF